MRLDVPAARIMAETNSGIKASLFRSNAAQTALVYPDSGIKTSERFFSVRFVPIQIEGESLSILTLNKFLLGSRRESEGAIPETLSGDYLDVASRTIASIRRSVLGGETFVDLFDEMDSIRKDLHVETARETVSQCATHVEDVLLKYQNRLRQADQDRAGDFKNVLDILNEVLSYLTADNQKSEARRKHLESNLTLAARVDDISTL